MIDTEWLKNLKVGDKVIVKQVYCNTVTKEVRKIDRITPTGQIVIGNLRFRNNGTLSCAGFGTFYRLEIATPEEIDKIKKGNYVRDVGNKLQQVKEMTYEQAKEIAKIFGWEE